MSNFPAFSPVPAESLEAANEEIRRLKDRVRFLETGIDAIEILLKAHGFDHAPIESIINQMIHEK